VVFSLIAGVRKVYPRFYFPNNNIETNPESNTVYIKVHTDPPPDNMGFDLITRAAVTIDAESRCVWSKAKPTIHVNADPFLETVPLSACHHPSLM